MARNDSTEAPRAQISEHEIALIAELHEQHRGDFRKVAAGFEIEKPRG